MDWRNRTLYLIFTPDLCRADPWQTLDDCLAAGTHLVQWRAPTTNLDDLQRCLSICNHHRVPLLVNDDVETAAATASVVGAHVGQDDMVPATARALLRADQVLGVSCHDLTQARQAVTDGADYLGIGPCFPTATKGYETGLDRSILTDVFAAFAALDYPVFAIGGITEHRLAELLDTGCRRVAVSQAILGSSAPAGVVERMLATLSA